jgi:hypothetical protein
MFINVRQELMMKETVATLAQCECGKVIPMKESRRIVKQAGELDEKFLLAGWYPSVHH